MAKLLEIEGAPGKYLIFCPGCGCSHWIQTPHPEHDGSEPVWQFDGNFDKPTFSPSLLTWWGTPNGEHRCHSFIRNGKFEFLTDSTHKFSGQTVDVPEHD